MMPLLSIEDQKKIDAIVEDIKQRYDFSYPLDNLLNIANSANIRVYENDLSDIDPNLSGALIYDNPRVKTNPRVFIHNNMSKQRKNFTLAHELAHHFLHTGNERLRLDKLNYSDDQETFEETQANYFAASLLVPKQLFVERLAVETDKRKLAEYFNVSVPVIENRKRWIEANG